MGMMIDSEIASGLKRSRSRLDFSSCHQPYMRGQLIHITVSYHPQSPSLSVLFSWPSIESPEVSTHLTHPLFNL
jgi:hypothetical protein